MKAVIIRKGKIIKRLAELTTGFESLNLELEPGDLLSIKITGLPDIPESQERRVKEMLDGAGYLRLRRKTAVAELLISSSVLLYIQKGYIQGPEVDDVVALHDYIYREFLGRKTIEVNQDGGLGTIFQAIGEAVETTIVQGIELMNGVLLKCLIETETR